MLWNEARIYKPFLRSLQEGSPDRPPVMPKFYGFYIPPVAFDYRKLYRNSVRTIIKVQPNRAAGTIWQAN